MSPLHLRIYTTIALGCFVVLLLQIQVSVTVPTVSWGDTTETIASSREAAPLRIPSAHVAARQRLHSIIFVGDVLLARNIEQIMIAKGGDYPFTGVDFSAIGLQPAVVGNFEASVPIEHHPTKAFAMRFSVDAAYLESLYSAGFTHMSLANNHALDYGDAGLWNTRKEMTDREIEPFGAPDEAQSYTFSVLSIQGHSVAVVGLNLVGQTIDEQALSDLLTQVSDISDFQVVYVHWGIEYEVSHGKEQERWASFFVKNGADLIIGHHPHVVQDIDYIDGVPVFYSLGNYIFDQYFSQETKQGLMLHLSFGAQPVLHIIPVNSEGTTSQPRLMREESHYEYLATLAARSNEEIRSYIAAGYIPLHIPVATSPKIAMMDK